MLRLFPFFKGFPLFEPIGFFPVLDPAVGALALAFGLQIGPQRLHVAGSARKIGDVQRIEGGGDLRRELHEIAQAVLVAVDDGGEVQQLGAGLDIATVEVAFGEIGCGVARVRA